ncbi:hypothetical protein FRC08_015573 [Ceratobasidium sp. 394]|nr:hypothetical protein FRC08_015573 [Ceratobasidium sp. 394]
MTQKASFLPALNAELVVENEAIPAPDTNQVLVKITAAAINPVDNWHRSTSNHAINKYPAILGCDGAGGDRVFFQGNFGLDDATFQLYALADATLLAHTPSSISDEQASTLPVALATAITLLFRKTGFKPPIEGPTILIHQLLFWEAAGQSEDLVSRSAHILGVQVTPPSCSHSIGACRRIFPYHNHIFQASRRFALKSFGATHVFERTVSAETIHSIIQASGHAFPLAVDAVSTPETQVFAFKLLTGQLNPPQDLQLQLVLPLSDELLALNNARPEGPIKAYEVFGNARIFKELCAPFYGVAERWLEEGKLVPAEVQIVRGGLAGVSKALDLIAKGVSGVKLVIRPQE